MAGIPREHTELYFDKLCRTQKAETVFSLIQATYHSKKSAGTSGDVKAEIARRLQSAYDLFRDNIKGTSTGAGTYSGVPKQFESQYTIGHELCIWKNSDLDLIDLAEKVAIHQITIKDYFDIFFYNYFQPIDSKSIHPFYSIIKYMIDNNVIEFEKDKIPSILGVTASNENINALCNFLDGTNNIEYTGTTLKYVGTKPLQVIIKKCNIRYIGEEGLILARQELNTDEKYAEYITTELLFDDEVENNVVMERVKIIEEGSYQVGGTNMIIYGVPGCGKSHYVEHELLKHEGINNDETHLIRTTFFQDYSNTDFVGQILPKLNGDNVEYEFNPGPFTIALERALNNPSEKFALVIEEINRGNAASIFGDIFQLLDRDDDGNSKYGIINVNVSDYLKKEGFVGYNTIRIPSNLYIFATMNTSDQNVFTLDNAFKRRWEFERIPNEFTDEHPYKDYLVPGMEKENITWENLVSTINDYIIHNSNILMNEDKQIGIYFIKEKQLIKQFVNVDAAKRNQFAYKFFEYLWDDVSKIDHSILFNNYDSLDHLINTYQNVGSNVFIKDVHNAIISKVKVKEENNTNESIQK